MGLPAEKLKIDQDEILKPLDEQIVEEISSNHKKIDGLSEIGMKAKEQQQISKIRKNLQSSEHKNENNLAENPDTKATKDKYKIEYLEQNQDKLAEHLQELLNAYTSKSSTEDQAKLAISFEATIDYCIENGKAYAELIILKIIQGTAKGIIRNRHLSYYQKYINSLPALEYLYQTDLKDKSDFQKLASKFSGKAGLKKFKNFYWTKIMNNMMVQKRTDKSASRNTWDHDYAGEIIPAGNLETLKKFVNKKTLSTAIQNAYSGTIMNIEENVSNKKGLARAISSFVMVNGILDNTAYKDHDEYARWNNKWNKNIPRIANITNHPNMNMSNLRTTTIKALSPLDKVFFENIINVNEKSFEKLKKHLEKKYKIQIRSLDDAYDRLDDIISLILKKAGWFKRSGLRHLK